MFLPSFIAISGHHSGGFLSVMPLRPTLLINQSGRPSKIWDLWGTSNYRGVHVVGNGGRVCNVAGSKAVFLGMADTSIPEAIHVTLPGNRIFLH